MPAHSSPVAFEVDDHPNLARNLERDLQAAKASSIEGLTAAKDWADFQKRRALDYMQAVASFGSLRNVRNAYLRPPINPF